MDSNGPAGDLPDLVLESRRQLFARNRVDVHGVVDGASGE